MKNENLISVLMAVYNCENTLAEAVECIIKQTYENWELILIDDCSIDNTYAKALELSQNDNRIKVFRNEKNLTLAPTLNRCLRMAKGEYTARMDGDDVCDITRFEKEAEILNNHPEYSVVSCNMKLYDQNGNFGLVTYKENPQKSDFVNGSPICHAGCMMRRAVLEDLNGYSESRKVERIEDYDLWIRLYEKGYKAYNIQEPLYSMREDRNAVKRKKYKFRVTEYQLKRRMCRTFELPLKYKLKAFKPLIVGLMPSSLYSALHRKKYEDQPVNEDVNYDT